MSVLAPEQSLRGPTDAITNCRFRGSGRCCLLKAQCYQAFYTFVYLCDHPLSLWMPLRLVRAVAVYLQHVLNVLLGNKVTAQAWYRSAV